jgi:alpha-tubulin suppressor-like RCC1 family protein
MDFLTQRHGGCSQRRRLMMALGATFAGLIMSLVGTASAVAFVADWGNNKYGELGNGTKINSDVPVFVSPLTEEVTAVASGAKHNLALLSNGTVIAWGENHYGELGNGTKTISTQPVAVKGLSGVVAISAGEGFSEALLSNGTVMAWGRNARGQLGDGTTVDKAEPVAVGGLTERVTAISAGRERSLALLSNGTVEIWGSNTKGELGINTRVGPQTCGVTACATAAVPIPTLSGVIGVSVGYSHSMALLSNGTAMAWGGDSYGELGAEGKELGSGQNQARSYVPIPVRALTNAIALSAANKFSTALLSNGTVMTWGRNTEGELGNGTIGEGTSTSIPGPVPGLSNVTAISAGGSFNDRGHVLVRLSNGTAMAWGDNIYGELGNGTTTTSDVPVAVSGLTGVKGVSAGKWQSAAFG